MLPPPLATKTEYNDKQIEKCVQMETKYRNKALENISCKIS